MSMSLPHVTVLGDEVTGLLVPTMLLCWLGSLPDPESTRWHISPSRREHLYAPGNLGAGMEPSMAPLEGTQGWRCPHVPSRNSV